MKTSKTRFVIVNEEPGEAPLFFQKKLYTQGFTPDIWGATRYISKKYADEIKESLIPAVPSAEVIKIEMTIEPKESNQ